MADLKADTILSKVYFKDNKGNLLYQTLEPTEHGVTLKGYSKGSCLHGEETGPNDGYSECSGHTIGQGCSFRVKGQR